MSISPFDLRINNLVNVLNVINESGFIRPHYWTVKEICVDTVTIQNGIYTDVIPYSRLSPITLTEEWLQKICEQKTNPYKLLNWDLYINDQGMVYFFLGGVEVVKYTYLHDLQNFVGILTGTELTIKETA